MLIYNRLVFGGTLAAITYAFQNNLPIIFSVAKPPLFFEDSVKDWNQMIFILGVAGLHPLTNRASLFRLEGKNTLKAIVGTREERIEFKELFIFDDEGFEGLPTPTKKIKKHLVLDWMVPKSCSPHSVETLSSEDEFVKEITFYSSSCHSGRALVVKSFLTRQELESYEYSDTYARFKTEKMMKEAGIIGKRNGDYHILLESKNREIKKNKMFEYENTDVLKFIYNSPPKSGIIEDNLYLDRLKTYFGKRVTE